MSNKKILLINGHPDKESYNTSLAEAYKKGALAAGAEVKEITIADLEFNPVLQYGYRKRTDLEPDLLDAQEKIRWADHLVWVFPIWWGGLPALTKGFIDRVFLPGFAFKFRPDSLFQEKLLTHKTARIICTLDQPNWYFRLINHRPAHHAMKKMTLQFCGINPVKITTIGPIRLSGDVFRNNWIGKAEALGRRLG